MIGASSVGFITNFIFPDSIFSMSRMSLMSRTRRSVLVTARSIIYFAGSGSFPVTPPATSPSEPRMDVSGVRIRG